MRDRLRKNEDESGSGPATGGPDPAPAAVFSAEGGVYLPPTTPTRQFADLVLAPVQPAKLKELSALLAEIGKHTKAQMKGAAFSPELSPFHAIKGLHFARFVLLGDKLAEDHKETRTGLAIRGQPLLAFATDYDGPEGEARCSHERARKAHQAELLKHEAFFARVFSHCEGYRESRLSAFLNRHQRAARTAYVAAPGRSVAQIRWEAALQKQAQALLSQAQAGQPTPEAVRQQIKRLLAGAGRSIPWFPPQPDLEKQLRNWLIGVACAGTAVIAGLGLCLVVPLSVLGLPGVGLAFSLSAGGAIALVGAGVARLRHLESHDAQFQPELNQDTHAQLGVAAADENEFLQNQLTHVVRIKDGPLRWLLIRIVFYALQKLADYRFNRGKLGEIPSIHFARWVLGPQRSVIFFSNFDSSWQSYLGDFIDKASTGLTAVWSNTEKYPRTKWLLKAGSRDAARFLSWTRYHQEPTQVWYSAYPGLSVVNINANTELRRGLADLPADAPPGSEVDPVSWLSRLRNVDRREVDERYGAEQARETPLDLNDIQGIILKGYGHKQEARYLLLSIRAASPALVQWLAALPVTSTARGAREKDAKDPLLNVAFTYEGLKQLQLEPELCDAFSTAFVQGSMHEDRRRVNHDVRDDAPEHWEWGNRETPVHLALMIFAEDKDAVEEQLQSYLAQAEAHGLQKVSVLEATTLPGRSEHFGFRDGIAQPVLKGSGDPGVAQNTIAAGEILLGHRDGYGNVSHAPTSSEGFRFGFNGSYMVLRQLEQNVEAFWKSCANNGQALGLTPVHVASKMVGRWPTGRPLVRCPDKDPEPSVPSDDDGFGYFETGADNDRYGGRCPFGAHIRRSNPRDWGLGESSEESIRLSNLHRIMRRGRPYGPPLHASMNTEEMCRIAQEGTAQPSAKRGLQFICFNANIERQFEFIQQQWCKNPKFAGQYSDADPLLGLGDALGELGIDDPGLMLQDDPHAGKTRRLSALTPFVRLRGSAYFFMPSLSALRLLPQFIKADSTSVAARFEHMPDDEQLHTDRLIDNTRALLQQRYAGKQTLRDAHPKMHGCVKARLEIEPNLPPALRHGLFGEAAERYATKTPDGRCSFKAWVRFSSQNQDPQADIVKDTRGLSLKLLEIPGAKLLDGEEDSPCHDFIFLSTPRFVARSVAEFDELVNGLVQGSWLSWLRSAGPALRHKFSLARHASPLEVSYFSVVPALIGTTAVKYSLEPVIEKKTPLPKHPSPNFLREQLKRQLAHKDSLFEISVQMFQDEKSTPIEDPTQLWRTKPTKVATLRILQQDDFDTPERNELGENLAFNPFRCLPEHRPLGGINRARRQVYRAIAAFRHNRNGVKSAEAPVWE
jgi:Dyp-type peroxidase family